MCLALAHLFLTLLLLGAVLFTAARSRSAARAHHLAHRAVRRLIHQQRRARRDQRRLLASVEFVQETIDALRRGSRR